MKITFTCDPNASWMLVGNFSVVPKPSFLHYTPSNCTYLMQLPYDGACYSMPTAAPIPSSSSTGISVGSILLIVFFTGSISYLILGCVFNYSNGAVGRELWPHYEFWVDLPELIKDGFIFTFKVLTCTDAHLGPQYEAI
ncbi:PREDICTED: uncharacterized protein LOC106805343 [Priapulus caudatus]|uniref:Uncharacterized protein LOC106805343 n=1 Tax=Priapulus caudatus TaxID=37621 RepID=A0ABM1DR11_PRICU|nr:PREDICTED: uncharacterized protein LOC106805343 [Priapulus caudatus]